MSSTEETDGVVNALVESAQRVGIGSGSAVLVGCSGGLDSTVLLSALCSMRDSLRLTVRAAYYDHGIRPAEERRRERRLVRRNAERLGVELVEGSAAAGAMKREAHANSESLEAVAREARLRFFGACLSRDVFEYVALAHHLDDQVETVVMRMLQGSGLRGLCGIAESSHVGVRGGRTLRLWHPLLQVEKQELRSYAELHALEYVEDSTNRRTEPLRNRIRQDVVPMLQTVTDGALSKILIAREKLTEADAALDVAAAERCEWRPAGDAIMTDRAAFESSHREIKRRVLYNGLEKLDVPPKSVPSRFLNPLLHRQLGSEGSGPLRGYGLQFRWDADSVFIRRDVVLGAKRGYFGTILTAPESNARYLRIVLRQRHSEELIGSVTVQAAALHFPLVIRTARAGDTIVHRGREVLLRKLLGERRIPSAERDDVPVVEDRRGIAAVMLSLWGMESLGELPDAVGNKDAVAYYTFDIDTALGSNG